MVSLSKYRLYSGSEADLRPSARRGNAENKAGYSRRNLFVPVPDIPDFFAFNAGLWEKRGRDAEREHYRKKHPIRKLWETDLLVIDKVGFIPLHKDASEPLFQVISDCYERKSAVLDGSQKSGDSFFQSALAGLRASRDPTLYFFEPTPRFLLEKHTFSAFWIRTPRFALSRAA